MSAATASSHGAGFGIGRLFGRAQPGDVRPARLTMRRVKFASSLFVGALMLGVVSNAMLLQPEHAPLRIASSLAPPHPGADQPAREALPVHDRAPGPARTLPRAVDPMPVGSIAPPAPAHDKPRSLATSSKSRPHRQDGIAAFLKDGKVR